MKTQKKRRISNENVDGESRDMVYYAGEGMQQWQAEECRKNKRPESMFRSKWQRYKWKMN